MINFKKYIICAALLVSLITSGTLCLQLLGHNTIQAVWASSGNEQQNTPPGGVSSAPDDQNLAPGQNQGPGPNQAPGGMPPQQGQGQRMSPPGGGGLPGGQNTGSKYSLPLAIYSTVLIIVIITAYLLYKFKNLRISPSYESDIILALLGIGLVFRLAIANSVGGHIDLSIFGNWASTAAKSLFQVYSGFGHGSSDYPPLYIYFLFLIGKLTATHTFSVYSALLLKLPSILADIWTSYIIFRLARKYVSPEISIMLSALYAFNPAVFFNSVFYGQIDSLLTFFVVSALYALMEKKIGFSACLFILAVMLKPQGIIFLPVLFFELVRQKNLKSFIKAGCFALGTAVAIVLPFALKNGALWIFKLYSNTISEYPSTSMNAFNFYSLIGANNLKDSAKLFFMSYHNWGMLFIILITAFSWFIYIKGNSPLFAPASALLQIAGVFTFSTSMHERYLFPAAAMAVLAFICLKDKRLLLFIIGYSATIYINTEVVLFGTLTGANTLTFNTILISVSLLNVLLFIYLAKVLFDIAVRKRTYIDSAIKERHNGSNKLDALLQG